MPKNVRKRNARTESFMFSLKLLMKNKLALTGLIIVMVYVILTVLDFADPRYLGTASGSINSLYDFTFPNSVGSPQQPTLARGWWYYLGTTYVNQFALLPSMLAALKIDIPISFEVVFIGALVGVVLGTTSGFLGGVFDEVMMRITDIFFSVPYLIMLFALLVVLDRFIPGLTVFVIALAIVWWPTYARLTRGQALSIKSLRYIEASVASGSSRIRNIFVHVLPNVLAPVFVQVSLDLGTIVLAISTLYFLGFSSFNPNTPELGNLMSLAVNQFMPGYWWTLIFPGIFLLIFTISINLFGDGLRDVLDPKVRR